MADQTLALIEEIREVASNFPLHGCLIEAHPYGSGHINDTFAVRYDQAGVGVRYVFQRINHSIFRDVPLLMDNIHRVTAHLGGHLRGDSRRALTLVSTRAGKAYHKSVEGNYWRIYLFIEKARSFDELESATQAFEAARAFGTFQKELADLPGKRLGETIPGFHDTRQRFEALSAAVTKNAAGRKKEVTAELDFVFRREAMVDRLLDLARSGALPERVTHNDTKINNVMLDDQTGEGICVIDLDTVMPGLSLYDFGDMVRTACSPAAEDERDLSKVAVRTAVFEALAQGFTEGASAILTDAEWENLAFSGQLMTFEVGMRFLTDYLAGDVYFKTKRPGHNLERCRTQFRLVECLEEAAPEMEKIVRAVRANVG
jgi:aminoglycoside phosphotransferase (APT) family kinase protein